MLLNLPPDTTLATLLTALRDALVPLGPWHTGHITVAGALPPWADLPALAICPASDDPTADGSEYGVEVWAYESLPSSSPAEDNLLGRTDVSDGILATAALLKAALATLLPAPGIEDVTVGKIEFGAGLHGESEQDAQTVSFALIPVTYTAYAG